jgi:hypothetical protein
MTEARTYGDGYRQAMKNASVERQIALNILREEMQAKIDALNEALRQIIVEDGGKGACSKIARRALGDA